MKTHDTLSISRILRSAKKDETFLTTAADKEIQSYAIREQCAVTTRRLQMIDCDRIFPLTLVTITRPVSSSRSAIFPRRARRKNTA
jgi:hypothetical protein